MKVDWNNLAMEIGETGGGTSVAMKAIEHLLGETAIRDAVDCFIAGGNGAEVAWSLLAFIRSPSAMNYCHSIIAAAGDVCKRQYATNLLGHVCDDRVLPWMPRLLSDPDVHVQYWAALIFEQLYDRGYFDLDEMRKHIIALEAHASPGVQRAIVQLNERFNSRRRTR